MFLQIIIIFFRPFIDHPLAEIKLSVSQPYKLSYQGRRYAASKRDHRYD